MLDGAGGRIFPGVHLDSGGEGAGSSGQQRTEVQSWTGGNSAAGADHHAVEVVRQLVLCESIGDGGASAAPTLSTEASCVICARHGIERVPEEGGVAAGGSQKPDAVGILPVRGPCELYDPASVIEVLAKPLLGKRRHGKREGSSSDSFRTDLSSGSPAIVRFPSDRPAIGRFPSPQGSQGSPNTESEALLVSSSYL